jgi:hypothetical protein
MAGRLSDIRAGKAGRDATQKQRRPPKNAEVVLQLVQTCDDGAICRRSLAMADSSTQNFGNYVRRDPLFHFFLLPVFAISVIGSFVHLYRRPGLHSAWMTIVMIAALVAVFKIRLYALKVQDRVIRLEERLRLMNLLDAGMRSRIGDFTEAQLIALRFASDGELPALAARALNEKLGRVEIKKAIREWRGDYWQV